MEFSTQFAQNMERFKPHTKTVIRFEDGIYGFESIKDYILIQEEKHAVIWSFRPPAAPTLPCLSSARFWSTEITTRLFRKTTLKNWDGPRKKIFVSLP